jgi:uncharacterized membrane protein YeaQ/YmgE (transglycosylase-associated protein family)
MNIPWWGIAGIVLGFFIYNQAKRTRLKKWQAITVAIVGAYVVMVAVIWVSITFPSFLGV